MNAPTVTPSLGIGLALAVTVGDALAAPPKGTLAAVQSTGSEAPILDLSGQSTPTRLFEGYVDALGARSRLEVEHHNRGNLSGTGSFAWDTVIEGTDLVVRLGLRVVGSVRGKNGSARIRFRAFGDGKASAPGFQPLDVHIAYEETMRANSRNRRISRGRSTLRIDFKDEGDVQRIHESVNLAGFALAGRPGGNWSLRLRKLRTRATAPRRVTGKATLLLRDSGRRIQLPIVGRYFERSDRMRFDSRGRGGRRGIELTGRKIEIFRREILAGTIAYRALGQQGTLRLR